MIYEVIRTELFQKKFNKLIPLNKQEDMENRIKKLEQNPFVGKPLGNRYLREMKLDKFRVYFAISDIKIIVLLLSVSDKKHQQETIDFLKRNVDWFEKQ